MLVPWRVRWWRSKYQRPVCPHLAFIHATHRRRIDAIRFARKAHRKFCRTSGRASLNSPRGGRKVRALSVTTLHLVPTIVVTSTEVIRAFISEKTDQHLRIPVWYEVDTTPVSLDLTVMLLQHGMLAYTSGGQERMLCSNKRMRPV